MDSIMPFPPSPVVPFVGTWIEILGLGRAKIKREVVPFVGTWIEIIAEYVFTAVTLSFPSWERGLKSIKKVSENEQIKSFP